MLSFQIEKDFDIVYPGKRNNFLTNWPEFGRKIFDHVFSIVARGDNKSLKINCSSLNIDLNIDGKIIILNFSSIYKFWLISDNLSSAYFFFSGKFCEKLHHVRTCFKLKIRVFQGEIEYCLNRKKSRYWSRKLIQLFKYFIWIRIPEFVKTRSLQVKNLQFRAKFPDFLVFVSRVNLVFGPSFRENRLYIFSPQCTFSGRL